MGRLRIHGGNTRVGEVYLDALFKQRALEQRENEVAQRASSERYRMDRQAEQAALQRSHDMAMAESARDDAFAMANAGRTHDLAKMAAQQEFSSGEREAQNVFTLERDVAGEASDLEADIAKEGRQDKRDIAKEKRITKLQNKRIDEDRAFQIEKLLIDGGHSYIQGSSLAELKNRAANAARDTKDDAKREKIIAGLINDGYPDSVAIAGGTDGQIASAAAKKHKLAETRKFKVNLAGIPYGASGDTPQEVASSVLKSRESKEKKQSEKEEKRDKSADLRAAANMYLKIKDNALSAAAAARTNPAEGDTRTPDQVYSDEVKGGLNEMQSFFPNLDLKKLGIGGTEEEESVSQAPDQPFQPMRLVKPTAENPTGMAHFPKNVPMPQRQTLGFAKGEYSDYFGEPPAPVGHDPIAKLALEKDYYTPLGYNLSHVQSLDQLYSELKKQKPAVDAAQQSDAFYRTGG